MICMHMHIYSFSIFTCIVVFTEICMKLIFCALYGEGILAFVYMFQNKFHF